MSREPIRPMTVGQLKALLAGMRDEIPVHIQGYKPYAASHVEDMAHKRGYLLVHAEVLVNEITGQEAMLWGALPEGETPNWHQRAVDAEEALRDWVRADQDLRDHPPNDTTKRWEEKRERVEAAREAARVIVEATSG